MRGQEVDRLKDLLYRQEFKLGCDRTGQGAQHEKQYGTSHVFDLVARVHEDESPCVRARVIACSGHAATHLPQPSHALGLMSKACCHLCTKPLMRPESFRSMRSLRGNV